MCVYAGYIHFMFENSCLGVIIALTQIYLFLWIAHRIVIAAAVAAVAADIVVVVVYRCVYVAAILNFICTSSMFNATHESSNNEQNTREEKQRQNIDVQLISLTMNARRAMVCINRRLARERNKTTETFLRFFSPQIDSFRIRFC